MRLFVENKNCAKFLICICSPDFVPANPRGSLAYYKEKRQNNPGFAHCLYPLLVQEFAWKSKIWSESSNRFLRGQLLSIKVRRLNQLRTTLWIRNPSVVLFAWPESRKFRHCITAPLHMRFLMRFLMRFRVQNAPYPTLQECFFSRSIAWIVKKVITYYLQTPLFPISANLAVFCRSVTRLKIRAGYLGQVLYAKLHQNRIVKNGRIKFVVWINS